MRLAIATTVEGFLPNASSLKRSELSFLESSQKEHELQSKKSFTFNADGHRLKFDHDSIKEIRKKGGGLLKNLLYAEIVNCDPIKAANPDVGVLECGLGRCCMESAESKLGGVCVDTLEFEERNLQEGNETVWSNAYSLFCEQNADKCECTDVSEGDYTLQVSCSFEDNCIRKESTCGERLDHCYSAAYTVGITAPGVYARSFCYDNETPYEQSVCYTGTSTESGFTCEMSFDNVTCNSCEVKYTDVAFCANGGNCTYFTNFPCYYFDCTNTAMNITGTFKK